MAFAKSKFDLLSFVVYPGVKVLLLYTQYIVTVHPEPFCLILVGLASTVGLCRPYHYGSSCRKVLIIIIMLGSSGSRMITWFT